MTDNTIAVGGIAPFTGCFDMLDKLVESGAIRRLNESADDGNSPANRTLYLVVYTHNAIAVMPYADAVTADRTDPDFLAMIPLADVRAKINAALN